MGVLLDIRYRFGFMSARAQRSALFQYHSLARARAEFKRNFAAMRARGQRFGTKQLADYLKANGWEAVAANWKSKLTKAVYESYDLPEKVYYDTMLKDKIGDAGQKILYFARALGK